MSDMPELAMMGALQAAGQYASYPHGQSSGIQSRILAGRSRQVMTFQVLITTLYHSVKECQG